jgi:hypothetical protein
VEFKHQLSLATTAEALWAGQAVLGMDGSVVGQKATYSWTLTTTSEVVVVDARGGGFLPPPARYTEYSSKRPEGAAIYAGLHWISQLLMQFPHTHPRVGQTPTLPVYADHDAVLKDLKRDLEDQTPTFSYLCPDHDIIQGIRALHAQLPINTVFSHVKSHQDRQHPIANLTPVAQINILADQNASAIHQKQAYCTGLFPTWIPGTWAALHRGSYPITKNLPAYLRTATHAPAMQEYLIHRSIEGTGRESPWDNYIFDSIAWRPLHEVFHKYSTGQRTQLSKYMNDLLPMARRLQTFDNTHDGRCFICGLLWEDTNHVLRRCGDERTLVRNKALQVFWLHLQQQHTPDILAQLLCDCIQ